MVALESIHLVLDITALHLVLKNIVKITKRKMSKLFYSLAGDVPNENGQTQSHGNFVGGRGDLP